MLYVHITSLKCTNREWPPPPPCLGTERYEPIVTYATSLAGLSIIISMTTQPLSMCHYPNITEPSNCCVTPNIFGHSMEKSMDRHTPPLRCLTIAFWPEWTLSLHTADRTPRSHCLSHRQSTMPDHLSTYVRYLYSHRVSSPENLMYHDKYPTINYI